MCPIDNPTVQSSDEAPPPPPEWIPYGSFPLACYNHAAQHLHPFILNHSIRVFQYARALAIAESYLPTETDDGAPIERMDINGNGMGYLFAACILHDIGTTSAHNGDLRFEVEGADAAASILRKEGLDKAKIHEIWTAIALHTSPHIAEKIGAMARIVRQAVTIDFKRPAVMHLVSEEKVRDVEGQYPRGKIEKVLGDAVAEQAVGKPGKAPDATWPGALLRAKRENPEWEGVNKGF